MRSHVQTSAQKSCEFVQTPVQNVYLPHFRNSRKFRGEELSIGEIHILAIPDCDPGRVACISCSWRASREQWLQFCVVWFWWAWLLKGFVLGDVWILCLQIFEVWFLQGLISLGLAAVNLWGLCLQLRGVWCLWGLISEESCLWDVGFCGSFRLVVDIYNMEFDTWGTISAEFYFWTVLFLKGVVSVYLSGLWMDFLRSLIYGRWLQWTEWSVCEARGCNSVEFDLYAEAMGLGLLRMAGSWF